jgi:hypothetical protein
MNKKSSPIIFIGIAVIVLCLCYISSIVGGGIWYYNQQPTNTMSPKEPNGSPPDASLSSKEPNGSPPDTSLSSSSIDEPNGSGSPLSSSGIDANQLQIDAGCYWSAYPDVAKNTKYGIVAGAEAARQHYDTFGKNEGRVWGCKDILPAECYWKRYPDVAQNKVYGRSAGIKAARQHYDKFGKNEGRKWGCD